MIEEAVADAARAGAQGPGRLDRGAGAAPVDGRPRTAAANLSDPIL